MVSAVNGHGARPIRIGNCSGSPNDNGSKMYEQAVSGPIDAITGDYLAELNIASAAELYRQGKHTGWEPTAEDGLLKSLEVIVEKKIKIVVNGGARNPSGLAKKIRASATAKSLDLKIAYVSGDDVFSTCEKYLSSDMRHLDAGKGHIKIDQGTNEFLRDPKRDLISANAYLGGRAIVKGLQEGADIIICGRVADASPVIGLAAWWHNWSETDFDALAGSLLAGHLIECSSYATGGNFCDFARYPFEKLLDIAFPIAEIANDGTFVICKHESLNGIINIDTARAQLLYELQGNVYLNGDVKADISDIQIAQEGKNRVRFTGVKGFPPPATTKLAIFYKGGYQTETVVYATGRNTDAKFKLFKYQVEYGLKVLGATDDFSILEFQVLATGAEDAPSQKSGTSALRIFGQARRRETLVQLSTVIKDCSMQTYSGKHQPNVLGSLSPSQYLGYYPSLIEQSELDEIVTFLDDKGNNGAQFHAGHVTTTEKFENRQDYDTKNPVSLSSFGETLFTPMDEVVLGRSGDKGGNINLGLFVHEADEYEWLRTFFSKDRLQKLMGDDWKPEFYIERVEMPKIYAVHFVIYGILGRGVASTAVLDSLGKGFTDWIRSRKIDLPIKFIDRYKGKMYSS